MRVTRIRAKLLLAERDLEHEKRQFSLYLQRPSKHNQPETYGRLRLVVRAEPDATVQTSLADIAHVATYEELLDDVLWEDLRERTARGEFAGASMQLPYESFTSGLRPKERPAGTTRLRGEVKEKVRRDTVLSRRIATLATALQ